VIDDVPQHRSPDDAARWNRRERVRLAGLATAAVAGVYLIVGTVGVDIPFPSALAGGRSAPAAPVRLSPSAAVPRRTHQPHTSSRPGRDRHGQRVDRAAHGRFENGGRGRVIGSTTTEQGETSPRPPSSPAPTKPANPAQKGVVAAPSPPSATAPAAPTQLPQVPSLPTPPSLPAPPPVPLPVPDPPSVPVPSVPPLSSPALPVP
jgi:hypothetical protein